MRQLQYSSVENGPAGHSGFQFVAAGPGVDADDEQIVAPFMTYRAPLDAPNQPTATELEMFPVALTYTRAGSECVVARSRYLGRDYSGRYGNYLAHAVILTPEELEGLRPIELWRSTLWPDRVSADPRLPDRTRLEPGSALNPVQVQGFLAGLGDRGFEILAGLLTAVDGDEPILLTSAGSDDIALFIAAVSYSLPTAAVTDLSFTTYSGEPGSAHQRIVGTTRAVWEAMRPRGTVFHLDVPARVEPPVPPRRYVALVVDAWRAGDFDRLDEVVETAEVVGDIGAAGTVCAFVHGAPLRAGDVEVLAGCLHRAGALLPESAWRALDEVLPTVALSVALRLYDAAGSEHRGRLATGIARSIRAALDAAREFEAVVVVLIDAARAGIGGEYEVVRAAGRRAIESDARGFARSIRRCPQEHVPALLDGAFHGLALADWPVRVATLTDEVCAQLPRARRLPEVLRPYTLVADCRHDPGRRSALVTELAGRHRSGTLADGELGALIGRAWRDNPATVDECAEIVAQFGVPAVLGSDLSTILLATLEDPGTDWYTRAEFAREVDTAAREQALPRRGVVVLLEDQARFLGETAVVMRRIRGSRSPMQPLQAAYRARRHASPTLVAQGLGLIAGMFAYLEPRHHAEVLVAAPEWHQELLEAWLRGSDEPRSPVDIVELVLRTRRLHLRSPELERLLRAEVRGKGRRRGIETELRRRDQALERELVELLSGPAGSGGSRFSAWKGRSGRE